MKKLMLLLLMIISIIPLVSCKEEKEEKEEDRPILYEVKHLLGNNSEKTKVINYSISTNKYSYEVNEEIELVASITIINGSVLGKSLYIELLENDCFLVLTSKSYFINLDVQNTTTKYDFYFKIRAIKESLSIGNLNFKISLKRLLKPYYYEDMEQFINPYEYVFYPYIYFIVDENGSFFAGDDYHRRIRIGKSSYPNVDSHSTLIHYRLNLLYEQKKINKEEYIRRLNLYLNNSIIFKSYGTECYYISPNMKFKIDFTHDDYQVRSVVPNEFILEMLKIAYNNNYISLEIYENECKLAMVYAYMEIMGDGGPYDIYLMPFETNKEELAKYEVYYMDGAHFMFYNVDFGFEYDKLPYGLESGYNSKEN